MRVLSLFDGISGTQQALKNIGIVPEVYYASEIDKYAISVTMKNHPNTIQLGDITKLHDYDFGEIDLMTWGSPCQDLSIAKKDRQGLAGIRSGLFYDAVKIWERVKPKYWMMENVKSMPKEAKDEISRILGVEPLLINSALVTAQQRKRYYWTNIPSIIQPEDKKILLKDILESGTAIDVEGQGKKISSKVIDKSHCLMGRDYKGFGNQLMTGVMDIKSCEDKSYCIPSTYYKENTKSLQQRNKKGLIIRIGQINKGGQGNRIYSPEGKSVSISANGGGQGAKTGLYACALRTYPRYPNGEPRTKRVEVKEDNKANSLTSVQTDSMILQDYVVRKLTPIECERLQGFPDNYTFGVSNTQRYKCLGNSFTVPIIEHILSFI